MKQSIQNGCRGKTNYLSCTQPNSGSMQAVCAILYITTVIQIGYRLITNVEWRADEK